eukprot:3922538-Pyramimonas_sp.AAC.1
MVLETLVHRTRATHDTEGRPEPTSAHCGQRRANGGWNSDDSVQEWRRGGGAAEMPAGASAPRWHL